MVVYYVDYTNGVDTLPGLREPVTGHYHAEAGSNNTTTVCAASLTGTAEDGTAYVGAFIWNRTRGAGAFISAFVHSTHTLTHGTITGNVNTDEFYIVKAWKTTGKATTTAAVGDICYVRAGLTDTLAAIVNFTNDGTVAAYISVIGMGTGSATLETIDETATEAWHDASTTRPIIDGGNAAYYVTPTNDDFWQMRNLDIRNTNASAYGCLHVGNTQKLYVHNCVIRDQASSGGFNLSCSVGGSNIILEDCDINNSNGTNISSYGKLLLINCVVNSGALGSTIGCVTYGSAYLVDCVFGGVATHSTSDITAAGQTTKIYTKNCDFNSTKITFSNINTILSLFEEDAQQVYGAHIATGYLGVAERVTDVVRTGGATSSVKIIPTTYVGLLQPFCLCDWPKPTWQVWLPAGAATITVYVRGLNWAVYPTAAQLYLEAEYVTDDTTGAITRSTVVSDEVLTDNTTWVGLQCAVNPHVASFVNLKLVLGLYEDATTGVYVDIKPVIS